MSLIRRSACVLINLIQLIPVSGLVRTALETVPWTPVVPRLLPVSNRPVILSVRSSISVVPCLLVDRQSPCESPVNLLVLWTTG